jgi:hypothetical protein
VYDIVTSRGGRFVRRNKAQNREGSSTSSSFAWEELSDKQAYEKICQTLRGESHFSSSVILFVPVFLECSTSLLFQFYVEGAPELRRRMLEDVLDEQRQYHEPYMLERLLDCDSHAFTVNNDEGERKRHHEQEPKEICDNSQAEKKGIDREEKTDVCAV